MELHFGLFISSSSLLTIPSLFKPFWLQGSESGGVVATLRTKRGYQRLSSTLRGLPSPLRWCYAYKPLQLCYSWMEHRADARAAAAEEDLARGRALQESARGRAARGASDEPRADARPEEAARGRVVQESARGRALGGPERAAAAEPRLGHPHGEDGWRFRDDGYQRLVVDEEGVPQSGTFSRRCRRVCYSDAHGQERRHSQVHRGRSIHARQ